MSGKSKFLSLFYALPIETALAFDLHLRQCYSREKNCLRAFEYIRRFHPGLTEKKMKFERAYKKVFGEPLPEKETGLQDQKTKNFQNLLSKLYGWLKKFLLDQKIQEQHSPLEKELLWHALQEALDVVHLSSRQRAEWKQKVEQAPQHDVQTYLQRMMASYQLNYPLKPGAKETQEEDLLDFTAHLDSFYALTRLKLACEMTTKAIAPAEAHGLAAASLSPPGDFIASLSPVFLHNHPLVAIYSELFQTIVHKQFDTYEKAEALFRKYFRHLSDEEQSAIMVYLQNYAANRISAGEAHFLEIVHQLNVFGIEQGFFIKSGLLSATHFNNIIAAACKAGNFDWAKSFLKRYNRYLEESMRGEKTALGEATIYFESRAYDKTVFVLKNLITKDIHGEIRLRCLTLMSHWELQDDFDVLAYCFALEQYLNRHKKSDPVNTVGVLNFVKIFRCLVFKRKDQAWLLNEIDQTKPLFFRDWLQRHAHKYQAASHKRRW